MSGENGLAYRIKVPVLDVRNEVGGRNRQADRETRTGITVIVNVPWPRICRVRVDSRARFHGLLSVAPIAASKSYGISWRYFLDYGFQTLICRDPPTIEGTAPVALTCPRISIERCAASALFSIDQSAFQSPRRALSSGSTMISQSGALCGSWPGKSCAGKIQAVTSSIGPPAKLWRRPQDDVLVFMPGW